MLCIVDVLTFRHFKITEQTVFVTFVCACQNEEIVLHRDVLYSLFVRFDVNSSFDHSLFDALRLNIDVSSHGFVVRSEVNTKVLCTEQLLCIR